MGQPTTARHDALRRTTDDRVVAGVCGGLAERLSIDAVAVRIVFVLGAMVWGVSLPLYGILWRFLPSRDAPTRNPVRPNRLPSMSLAMGAVAFMSAAMVALRSLGALPPDAVVLPLSLASLGVMFLWAGQPLRPVHRAALGTGARLPTDEGPPGRAASAADEPKKTRPERQRAPFGSALVGAIMIVACFGFLADRAGWLDVQWRLLGALLLVVIGVVLIGGATRGRPTGLMGAGGWLLVLLLGATVFQVPFGSGVGARDLHPVDVSTAETHLAGGSMVIDLRDVELDPEASAHEVLDASIAVGDLRVIVPVGVEVQINAWAGLGSVTVFADSASGVSVERSFASGGYDGSGGQLTVDASVGLGRVIVEQGE